MDNNITQRLLPACGDKSVGLHTLSLPLAESSVYAHRNACRIFQLDADFTRAGAWAGVEQLTEIAYVALLAAGRDDIIAEHAYELSKVLLNYRQRIRPQRLCLTDTANAAERTRFYPLDRAHRLVHGLVGMILQWREIASQDDSWVVIVRNFDKAQHLAARFFVELAQRAVSRSGIGVVFETSAPHSTRLRPLSAGCWLNDIAREAMPVRKMAGIDVKLLDAEESSDTLTLLEQAVPALYAQYPFGGSDLQAARLAAKIFIIYNSHGYYHEARQVLESFLPHFEALVGNDEALRIDYVGKINICLAMTEDPEGALRVVGELAADYLTKPHLLANMNYMLGMHYLRYADAKDISKAESYIVRAVQLVGEAHGDPEAEKNPFQKVFIDNGLAFLRARQGRHQEALDLCKTGYAFLTREMGEDRHRLHRSVLQYNIAQVHVMLGRLDEGVEHYRNAIAMDPYYSEYHNEIGNLLQEREQYEAAIAHYRSAIACSAPYDQVHFNKAVCHLRLGETGEALESFRASLELDPAQPAAQALLGDLLRELGRTDEALAAYDAALALGYDVLAVHVNRAVLHYEAGSYKLALADMDYVISRDPQEADHYENRAAIHEAMHEQTLYQRDLASALRCRVAA